MLAILGHLDALGLGADDGDAPRLQRRGEVQGSLTSELDDDRIALLPLVDVEDILECEGLEEELVARVVVGGDGLGIRVHHDGLEALLLEGEGCMDATVVELDPLTDAVGAAAEDHHLFLVPPSGFVLVTVGGVEIGRRGLKLGGAGIDQPVGRFDSLGLPLRSDGILGGSGNGRQLTVRETELLRVAEGYVGGVVPERLLLLEKFLNVVQEPGVDGADLMDLLRGESREEGMAHGKDPFGIGDAEETLDRVGVPRSVGLARFDVLGIASESGAARLQRAECFLERLLEGASDRHRLADALHLTGEGGVCLGEFLEGEAGDFHHAVVDGGFEAGRRGLGDVVFEFVEAVADGEFRSDLGDRVSGRLGGECRGTRDAGIHLDDDLASILGVHRKLNVGSPGLHADRTDHGE